MSEHKPHLLLVNAVPEDSEKLIALLSPLPLQLTAVTSGLEAIEVLRRTPVDLIVSAIAIGEFDSWKLARIVRSGVYCCKSDVPIILVTRIWCERITEVTAREFGINHLLAFEEHAKLPDLVRQCLAAESLPVQIPKLLVIEDTEDTARLVQRILKDRFTIELASDGQLGLAAWQRGRHQLVLLDVMLPKLSGVDVLEEILSEDPHQPVVVMTAHGTVDLAEQLMRRGAVDFITKPFRAEQLRQVCELAARREDYLISHEQFARRLESTQQLQQLLSNIVDSMPSILIAVDQDCLVTQWNQQAESLFGLSAKEVFGKSLADLQLKQVQVEEVRQAMADDSVLELAKVAFPEGGVTHYYDKTIYPLSGHSCLGAVIRIDDVTERVLLEERVIQSKKMASLGELVAGIAHEINNPLAGILQNTQVVRNRLDPQVQKNLAVASRLDLSMEKLTGYLEERGVQSRLEVIMDAGGRAAKIIDNMLSFSRQRGAVLQPENLANLLDRSLELAASHYNLKNKFDFRSIEIVRDYPDQLPLVECDAGQIQQVLLNLLMNGAQAMAEKTKKLQDAGEEPTYRARFHLRLAVLEGSVQIEVEDNGPGIGIEAQKRVFDPFFTTKGVGEGTGLGLFLSYVIITENHAGLMRVDSQPGQGAKFTISLPFASEGTR